MKKAALTTAILAVMASGSAAAATVYKDDTTELKIGGRAEARFNISDNNESATDSTFADKSRARLNIVGKSQISEAYTALVSTKLSSTLTLQSLTVMRLQVLAQTSVSSLTVSKIQLR